jgi:short subunit dehydrogenase-like uncharacterized protein
MAGELLIYGSYGYTGKLVAKTAVEAGMIPILAGRRTEALEAQALELGLDHRTFSLDHPAVVADHVGQVDAVLNCAGPYSGTAGPLVRACLRTGTDYLDLDAQIDILEHVATRDADAVAAGVTLLPAVGFSVVTTDCLAVHLADQVDRPIQLRLALDGLQTYSSGTVKSILEGASRPGAVREHGKIRDVPVAWKTREFAFGADEEPKPAVTLPWGDISTAYHATGIPNIETYATVPAYARTAMERAGWLTTVVASKPVRGALEVVARAVVSGPTAAERAQSVVRIVGEVESASGDRASARMRTPDTYDLTAKTAVDAARRVLDGEVPPGFWTPGGAFGPDYVLGFTGVKREDVDTMEPPRVESPSG